MIDRRDKREFEEITGHVNDHAKHSAGAGVFRLIATGNVFGPATAGNDALSGDYNFAAGDESLDAVTTGTEIVSIGRKTLSAVTKADYITAVGNSALEDYDDTTALAGYLSVYGFYAGQSLTEGDYAVIIGAYACNSAIAVGEGDIYIGSYCGSDVVATGGGNIAIGSGAMGNANGNCLHNICIGDDAGEDLTNGDHNLFGGEDSGGNITTGSDNVFWGDLTGGGLTAGSTGNVCLGKAAGPAASGVQSDKLWLDNHQTDTPLIKGDFSAHTIHIGGTLSKTAGTFRIDHPLDESKHLIHGFIEGPEYGLLYRGRARLVNGEAIVNIDVACGMSLGTFEAIAQVPTFYLQNMDTFGYVMGRLDGNILTLMGPGMSQDEVSWLICAERKDKFVMECAQTDDGGHLILEPDKESL